MTDSVTRLKELLFDREAATLADIAHRLDALARSEAQARADLGSLIALGRTELAEADRRLDEATKARFEELSRLETRNRELHEEVGRRLADLDRRMGTPEALRTSVAEVLDEVIVEARRNKQDDVSRALAPMLVKTIKAELKNNQAEMVEALYPITGQLVKAYVASAMKELTARINRRFQSNGFMLRTRSIFSGYSVAELALAESERLEVVELYLVRRGSGELLQRWPSTSIRSNSDIHMSSIMAAINDFAADAFQADGGQLRAFDIDDFKVYLRASPVYLLAAKCRGTAAPGVDGLIDAAFLDAVAKLSRQDAAGSPGENGVTAGLLADVRNRLEQRIDARHEELANAGMPFSPVRAFVAMAMLALAAGLGWYGYNIWLQEAARTRALAAIDATPAMKGYPVMLDVSTGGRAIAISGLAPSAGAKTDLLRRLSEDLPGVEIADRGLAALPAPVSIPDLSPEFAAVRRSIDPLPPAIASVRADVGKVEAGIAKVETGIAKVEAELTARMVREAVLRSLDRAERRLTDALPDLGALAGRGAGPRRDAAARMNVEAQRWISSIRARRTTIAESLSGPTREPSAAALVATADEFRAAAARLAGVPPSRPVAPAAGLPIEEAAEEIALAAERLATASAAALQAASLDIPPHPTARDALRAFVEQNAIFFANAEDFRDQARAREVVAELVRLARAAGAGLRVVGYTDERGSQTRNSPLALSRAERVVEALVAAGFPRARLVAVGRSTGPDLSPIVGPDSPNRRVEFELTFDGEIVAPR